MRYTNSIIIIIIIINTRSQQYLPVQLSRVKSQSVNAHTAKNFIIYFTKNKITEVQTEIWNKGVDYETEEQDKKSNYPKTKSAFFQDNLETKTTVSRLCPSAWVSQMPLDSPYPLAPNTLT